MKKNGFTLIELLIVIAIIAILSGILISVINPARQRAKAKDATIISTLTKVVTATEAFNSAYSSYPTGQQLLQELQNVTAVGTPSASALTFNVPSVSLPSTCASNGYASGSAQCRFYYYTSSSNTYVTARSEVDKDANGVADWVCWSVGTATTNGGVMRSNAYNCTSPFN